MLKVILGENASMPTLGSGQSAGFDLYSAEKITLEAKGKAIIPTNLKIQVPKGTYGRIAPRSGLAWKKFIDVGAGVIDADYRGNVGVVLFNHSNEDVVFEIGDRVAQLILEKYETAVVVCVDELDDTYRGSGGFGSTGS